MHDSSVPIKLQHDDLIFLILLAMMMFASFSLLALLPSSGAFAPNLTPRRPRVVFASNSYGSPRTGFLQSLLDLALDSPLWTYVLVPSARQKMVDTAASNGIPWMECKEWLSKTSDDWKQDVDISHVPSYYQKPFHAYSDGNLCWEAAWEAEIASASVGARNFPAYGRKGEDAFRQSFQVCLVEGGAILKEGAEVVDLGCGTGMSTRWLAKQYPQASRILGLDLSPYFCEIGQRLLDLHPKSIDEGGPWINAIKADDRINYQVAAAEATGLPDASVDIVNLQFVAHELPAQATLEILREAHRILKPNGQLWFCEMDFETPAYAAQRANPLLFSLIRATEPYLDEYADHAQDYRDELKRLFVNTKIGAATGRHFAIVATKGSSTTEDHVLEDLRFDENGNYVVEDTHLKTWENKV
jgi:ubiquinone/menaquinone biosynthesis C-methylase UbiE